MEKDLEFVDSQLASEASLYPVCGTDENLETMVKKITETPLRIIHGHGNCTHSCVFS